MSRVDALLVVGSVLAFVAVAAYRAAAWARETLDWYRWHRGIEERRERDVLIEKGPRR